MSTFRTYCTLSDSTYLPRLLAMYESLKRHSSAPFTLHILAMDQAAKDALLALNLPDIVVAWFPYFEQRGRRDHKWQEYCWLMASQWTETVALMTTREVTYLDADLFFFSDPEVIHREIGSRSIAIIPHRFPPDKKYLERNGLFNVSWVTFRDDEAGRTCLRRWAEQCREWCYARNESGRFGDQKYLDSWPSLYSASLCIVENIGAGLAPWNAAAYKFSDGPKVNDVPVVFYHLHEFAELATGSTDAKSIRLAGLDRTAGLLAGQAGTHRPGHRTSGRPLAEEHREDRYRLTNYPVSNDQRRLIYEPYIAAYERAKNLIESLRIPA